MSETSKFTEDILTTARERAETVLREAETETQRALEEAKLAISREVETVLRNARSEADAVKRRQISEARHRSKIREQQEKAKIIQEVMDRTKKRTVDLVGEETRYVPLLTRLIESGIDELGEKSAMIHLNEVDLKRTSNLEQTINKNLSGQIKVQWSKEPISAFGGAVISNPNGNVRIVNTIDQRLEALESKLLIEAGKSLFNE